MTYDMRDDLQIIANSLKLLPAWEVEVFWARWRDLDQRFCGSYFAAKMWLIVDTLHPGTKGDRRDIHNACRYLLWFFDHPQLHGHLDDIAGFGDAPRLGQFGRRWAETICETAWRVLLDTVDSLPGGVDLTADQIKRSLPQPAGVDRAR
jgi:hypothetical protein